MGMYSDLASSSPVERRVSVKKTPRPQQKTPSKPLPFPPGEQPTDRPDGRTGVRPKNRIRVRYAFEFYQDQILRLKEMRRSSITNDDEVEFSMSDYVRQALDDKLSQG
jgi:hypothetical protein